MAGQDDEIRLALLRHRDDLSGDPTLAQLEFHSVHAQPSKPFRFALEERLALGDPALPDDLVRRGGSKL